MGDGELAKLAEHIVTIKGEALTAQSIADKAMAAMSAHETICAERYQHIREATNNIPLLFNELGKIKNIVYIGVGIWVGIPVISGFMFGIYTVMKGLVK